MLHSWRLNLNLWVEAMHTAIHVLNRVRFRTREGKTSYELWIGQKPSVGYFSPCLDALHMHLFPKSWERNLMQGLWICFLLGIVQHRRHTDCGIQSRITSFFAEKSFLWRWNSCSNTKQRRSKWIFYLWSEKSMKMKASFNPSRWSCKRSSWATKWKCTKLRCKNNSRSSWWSPTRC
jgi:hypothetical protein